MGSANQVPYSLAGYVARDLRRGVLVLAADLCTIISRVLLTHCSFPLRQCAACKVGCGSERPRRSERSCWPLRRSPRGLVCVPAVTSAIYLPVPGAILSVVFNIVVSSFDGLVCTTIKTDNHHLFQEMRRPHFSLLRRGRCQITSRLIQMMDWLEDTILDFTSDKSEFDQLLEARIGS